MVPTFFARIRVTLQPVVKIIFCPVNTRVRTCETVHFTVVQTL